MDSRIAKEDRCSCNYRFIDERKFHRFPNRFCICVPFWDRVVDDADDCFEDYDIIKSVTKANGEMIDRAIHLCSQRLVIIKKIVSKVHIVSINDIKEVSSLLNFRHHNILALLDILVEGKLSKTVFLVTESYSYDLQNFLLSRRVPLSESQVKYIMRELFTGLDHLHESCDIIHNNISVNSIYINYTGCIKIGNFDYALDQKCYKHCHIPKSTTMRYWAPEVLLGLVYRNTGVDMWSAGCIFGELLRHRPLFPGESEVKILNEIFELLGTPDILLDLPLSKSFDCSVKEACIESQFYSLSSAGMMLLIELLMYKPLERGTAKECLHSLYFKDRPFACKGLQIFSEESCKNEKLKLKRVRFADIDNNMSIPLNYSLSEEEKAKRLRLSNHEQF